MTTGTRPLAPIILMAGSIESMQERLRAHAAEGRVLDGEQVVRKDSRYFGVLRDDPRREPREQEGGTQDDHE